MATPKGRVEGERVTLDRDAMKTARERAGVTQYDLADALGVRMQSVWRWEHGQQRPLKVQAEKIAATLGVNLSEIVTGDTEVTSSQDGAPVQSSEIPDAAA